MKHMWTILLLSCPPFANVTTCCRTKPPCLPNLSLIIYLTTLLLLLSNDVEMNPGPPDQYKCLSIAHMNVQSLYMTSQDNPYVKLNEIKSTFAIEKEVDVICISETWLHDQITDEAIMIEGYNKPHRSDRIGNRYGGVCAYVTENIVCERLKDLEPAGIELIWLELKIQLKKVIVGICYRAPRQNREEADNFLELLHTSVTNVIARGAESIVLLGDFNDTCTTWDSNHVHSELRNGLFDMVNILDMVQLVHEPTYILNQAANILDIVITDSPGYVKSIDILPPLGSHHAALYVEFQITYPRDKNYTRHVWDYSKGNYDLLNVSIDRYPWDNILNNDNLDDITKDLTSNFLNLCKDAIPNSRVV